MKDKKKALIIGCGRIGAFFDTPTSEGIYTHAKAYTLHNGIEIVGFFDEDSYRTDKAVEIWGGRAFRSLSEAMSSNPELVSICVPDEYHYQYLKSVAQYNPEMVLAEKPLTSDIGESIEIVNLYKQQIIGCNINYIRKFDPYLQTLREDFVNGSLGSLISGTAVYGKGILHNGSHLIDLFQWLFGQVINIKSLRGIYDYSDSDPSVDVWMQFERADSIYLAAINEKFYTAFEIELFFEKKKVSLTRGGLSCEETYVSDDDVFYGYRDLVDRKEVKTGLSESIKMFVENSYDGIGNLDILVSPAVDALRTQEICIEIIEDLGYGKAGD